MPELIGVVHLPALPGSPQAHLRVDAVLERARADAAALVAGGISTVLIENFGDVPFTATTVEPPVLTTMAVVGHLVRQVPGVSRLGINVLRNDSQGALAVAVAAQADFVRINVHTGGAWTDQGLIVGNAHDTLRSRNRWGGQEVEIWADVGVKHAVPAGQPDLVSQALDTYLRGLADRIIVTGSATGAPTDLDALRQVQGAVACPVVVGSGITPQNVAAYDEADALIVGSWFHRDGVLTAPVDVARVGQLVAALKQGP